jgi:hypothetical protein
VKVSTTLASEFFGILVFKFFFAKYKDKDLNSLVFQFSNFSSQNTKTKKKSKGSGSHRQLLIQG